MDPEFKIDSRQEFPHLPKAPIVEAVIAITAPGERAWEQSVISEELKLRLPDYPDAMPQKEFQSEVTMSPIPKAAVRDLGWKGMMCRSSDGLNIVTFNRDGFQFTRLRPYENWEKLNAEA